MSTVLADLLAPKPRCQCGHAHPIYVTSTARGWETLNDCVFCACEAYVVAEIIGDVSGPVTKIRRAD